jgi:hypothetical protein
MRLSGCAVRIEFSHESDLISSYLMQRRTISNMIASPLIKKVWAHSNSSSSVQVPTRAQCSRSSTLLCRRYGHHTLSRGEGSPPPSLSPLTFDVRFGLTIHTGSQREKKTTRNVGHSLSEDWTGNHRLVTWRTSKSTTTTLCPSASSSNT